MFYWLASYPKSGNTWLRAFLTNYWHNADAPISINALDAGPQAVSRSVFDTVVGVESSLLSADEADRYRPQMLRLLASRSTEPLFHKVHDLFYHTIDGEPLLPRDVTLGAVYLLRNPLDVAVSFAHHSNTSIDATISAMAQADYGLMASARHVMPQMRQLLGTWSAHVLSWVDAAQVPLHIMRYEDMTLQPAATFAAALRFIYAQGAAYYQDVAVEPERLERALRFSRFDVLQTQEATHGFSEKMPLSESFFRRGKVGSWRDALSTAQAARLIEDHRDVMRRFGYLTDDDTPIY